MPVTPEVEENQEEQELKEASATLKVQGQAELHKSLFQKQKIKIKIISILFSLQLNLASFPGHIVTWKTGKKWSYHYLN